MDVKMEYTGLQANEQAGIVVIGQSYAWLGPYPVRMGSDCTAA